MMEIGFDLFNISRKRFNRNDLYLTKEEWWARIRGNNKELWLGYDRETNRPAVFAINTYIDDYVDYTTMGISPDFPNNTYPLYGLIFEMNKYYLEEKNVRFVMDGSRSITEHSNIQSFLEEKFRFRKAFCDLQLYYKTWVGTIVKLMYPFRGLIKVRKLKILLNQEAMARGEY